MSEAEKIRQTLFYSALNIVSISGMVLAIVVAVFKPSFLVEGPLEPISGWASGGLVIFGGLWGLVRAKAALAEDNASITYADILKALFYISAYKGGGLLSDLLNPISICGFILAIGYPLIWFFQNNLYQLVFGSNPYGPAIAPIFLVWYGVHRNKLKNEKQKLDEES